MKMDDIVFCPGHRKLSFRWLQHTAPAHYALLYYVAPHDDVMWIYCSYHQRCFQWRSLYGMMMLTILQYAPWICFVKPWFCFGCIFYGCIWHINSISLRTRNPWPGPDKMVKHTATKSRYKAQTLYTALAVFRLSMQLGFAIIVTLHWSWLFSKNRSILECNRKRHRELQLYSQL